MTTLKSLILVAATLFALPALAHDGLHIEDAYARTMGSIGASGAVFLQIMNHGTADDRLIDAKSDAAQKVELHTHKDDGNGVMQMLHVPEGFAIPALGSHALQRGGDHVMLMGLTQDLKDGDKISVTLVFEKAGEMQIEATIDNTRKGPEAGMGAMGHGAHKGHDMSAMADTTGMSDADAIAALMKAQFETPENPLQVAPVTVEGDHALAGWAQGDKGGRALLARRDGTWEIVLCGGADLRMPAFLTQHGVSAADTLSMLYNGAEDSMGDDTVKLMSSFEGVVMISPKP